MNIFLKKIWAKNTVHLGAAGVESSDVPDHTAAVPYVDLKGIAVRPANPFATWRLWTDRVLTSVFAVSAVLEGLNLWNGQAALVSRQFTDGALLLSAAASTLLSLCSQLPAQNVILAAAVVWGVTGLVHWVNGVASVPLGPLTYHTQNVGRYMVPPLPWSVPVLWVISILNARGIARLILRPKRGTSHYGFWVLGVTVLLVIAFELAFQPFATQIKQYWSWTVTKLPWDYYSAPLSAFFGSGVMTFLILLFVTPALINKNPKPIAPSFHPLFVWTSLNALFLLGAAVAHLTAAPILMAIQLTVVVGLAVLGGYKSSTRA